MYANTSMNLSYCDAVAEGSGHVCNTYFGTKPPSLDIVRIFNFSYEVCRSLIVAAPEMDVGIIIEDLLPLLSYYAPFAIYHQYLQVKDFTPCESSIYALMGKIHKRLNMHAKDMFYFGIALDLKPPAADVAAIKSAMEKLHLPDELEDNL
ncbi:cell division cycle protein 27 homolog A-like isoform X1 [Asparagus officinalis]|uniref:cell division cycle protein 27 homolog A-like isoform X1 n=1 Tax=Asparagus officinalis TaxID=4686 RepID=UPI00098E7D04|nr:cell division cycle protein 27 homolog A-like isoform X1 [Asparagus officinalis]